WLTHVEAGADDVGDRRQLEPHVASSRSSSVPDTLVTGYIQDNTCRTSRSTDSGLSWQQSSYVGKPGNNVNGGDPSVSSQLDGTFLLGCLGITFGTEPFTGYKIITSSAIGFVSSTDSGMTWTTAAPEIIAPPGGPQIDKPWIATDWGTFGSHNNRLYACWTEFDYVAMQTRIHFAQILPTRTNDIILDSATWVDDADRSKGPYVQGCQVATGPGKTGIGNEIFVTWEKIENYVSGEILFNRNYNGGDSASWLGTPFQIGTMQRFSDTTSCRIVTQNTILDGCLRGISGVWFRANHLPYLAIDKFGDPHVTWTTFVNNSADIVYSSSYNCAVDEQQCTFSSQLTLDTNTNDQFHPAITVSDSSVNPRGIVIVTISDKREDNVSTPNETWKPWEFSCQPTSYSGIGSCLNASDWTNKKIADDESQFNEADGMAGEYHGLAYTRTNQAISIQYFRECIFPGCVPPASHDIIAYGGK
ncbi:MAG: hypothetical protein ACREBU_17625, partial [Nitrososphaera sp.]